MKKVLITMLMALVIASMCFITSNAEASIKVNVNMDKTTVKAGETVVLKISTSDFVDIAGEGIFGLSGEFIYDREVFEDLTVSDITPVNGWTSPQLSNNAVKFYVERNNFTNTPGEVVEVTFHVKSDAKTTNTEIRFNNITVVYDGGPNSPDLIVGDVVSSINIEGTTIEEPDDNNTTGDNDNNTIPDDNNIGNTNTSGNTNNNNNNIPNININIPTNGNTSGSTGGNNNNNSDKQISSLPYTGVQGFVFPAIMLIAVAGIIGYVKYRNME